MYVCIHNFFNYAGIWVSGVHLWVCALKREKSIKSI